MKKSILLLGLLSIGFASAQTTGGYVGINTTSPHATLDIQGNPTDKTKLDGLIPPRLTGNELAEKIYNTVHRGAMVYVTARATSLTGQVVNVTDAGYYYFDGTVWQAFRRSAPTFTQTDDWHTTGNAGTDPNVNFIGTTDGQPIVFGITPTTQLNQNYKGRVGAIRREFNPVIPDAENVSIALGGMNAGNFFGHSPWGIPPSTGTDNVAIGNTSFRQITTGSYNVALGSGAGMNFQEGRGNTFVGTYAGSLSRKGTYNTYIGNHAGSGGSGGYDEGNYNVAVGNYASGSRNSGNYNTYLGSSAGEERNSEGGDYNIRIGYKSGKVIPNTSTGFYIDGGNNNIYIGANTNQTSPTVSNEINIGNFIFGSEVDSFNKQLSGAGYNMPDGKLGISVVKPTEKLDVHGKIRLNPGRNPHAGADVVPNGTCPNLGTIAFASDGNFYGCAGIGNDLSSGTWKQLNN